MPSKRRATYGLSHGEAVSIGLVAACRLALNRGLCGVDLLDRTRRLLVACGLPVVPPAVADEVLRTRLRLDKKRRGDRLRFVLPRALGQVMVVDDVTDDEALAGPERGASVRIVVIHGPNLNLLGIREPEVYGTATLTDINRALMGRAKTLGVNLMSFQSNHEGDLIDRVQAMVLNEPGEAGLVINPGGYTHTSVALRDAIAATSRPAWEVHLSDPDTREEFRRVSLIRDVCVGCTKGKGTGGYLEALSGLVAHLRPGKEA